MSDRQTLGIMALFQGTSPNFSEKGYYRKLMAIGRRLGIRVFVFSPLKVNFATRQVIGYEYRNNKWKRAVFSLPSVVYDRCFICPVYRQYKPFIVRLQNDPKITFLGRGLTGKWQVYQMLKQSPEVEHWLPETELFTMSGFLRQLKQKGAVILKPAAGTHGARVIRVAKTDDGYEVVGRNGTNRPIRRTFADAGRLKRFIQTFTENQKFLIQTYLTLQTADGTPFDVRVLVQKNGEGKWQTTGKAVRLGIRQNITSNLHGGGKAIPLGTFLAQSFPGLKGEIEAEIDRLAETVPPVLEEFHGRLVELGIDIGIDRNGKVWLIEVNSKPGRNVFVQIHDRKARTRSMVLPVKYAHYLMKIV